MKKIIFLIENPYWIRDHHRYGAEYLSEKGYEVEIWRMMTMRSIEFNTQAGMYEGSNYYEYTLRKFKKEVKKNINSIYILQKSCDEYSLFLSRIGCKFIVVSGIGGVIGSEKVHTSKKLIEKIKRILDRGIFFSLRLYIYFQTREKIKGLYKKAIRDNPPALIITSTCYIASKVFLKEELNGNVMYVHAGDYDRYIETERKYGARSKKHIVYCDSGYADRDYDSALVGDILETAKYKDEYFDQLEKLFNKLEDHYQLPVVVAGHPHTKYSDGDFHGRKIVFNRICELTRDAAVFIVNTSTAMNFAEIYDVPTVKIVNKHFKNIIYPHPNAYEFIKLEADILGCGFLDLDDKEGMRHPWDYVKSLEQKKRDNFMERYVIDSNMMEKTIIEYLEEYIRRM